MFIIKYEIISFIVILSLGFGQAYLWCKDGVCISVNISFFVEKGENSSPRYKSF